MERRILIADDEPSIRCLLEAYAEIVSAEEVYTAKDAGEALGIVRNPESKLTHILTDNDMLEKDAGIGLLTEAARHYTSSGITPPKYALMTGREIKDVLDRLPEDVRSNVIGFQKPLTSEVILNYFNS